MHERKQPCTKVFVKMIYGAIHIYSSTVLVKAAEEYWKVDRKGARKKKARYNTSSTWS